MKHSEVWFYQLNEQMPLRQFTLRLCELSDRRQRPLMIFCPNVAQAKALDTDIWNLSPDRFLAHTLNNPDCPANIQIQTTLPTQSGDLLLNLSEQTLTRDLMQAYQRIIELIHPDNKELSRDKWRQYLQHGYQPELKPI